MSLQPRFNKWGSGKMRERKRPEIRERGGRKRGRAGVFKSMEQSVGG